MGIDPAQSRRGQWMLCRGPESCWHRDTRWRRWHRILGQSFVAGTSGELLAKASHNKEEILSCRWTSPKWTSRAPLAVPSRPPHRCLFRSHEAAHRLTHASRVDNRRGWLDRQLSSADCAGHWSVCALTRAPRPDGPIGGRETLSRRRACLLIHAAALSKSVACEKDPALARKLNVEVSQHLARCAPKSVSFSFRPTLFSMASEATTDEASL
jgi:hypothetical protein